MGSIDYKDTVLGIELGSTRIKAVLIDARHRPVASGEYVWESRFENGVWTYSMDDVWAGLQGAYAGLAADAEKKFGRKPDSLGAVGISGMMHGYLPFDGAGKLLCPFRTWQNTITGEAAAALTARFGFNIPQRWSIAHLYQAVLNGEEHVKDVAFITTLAGYVHWKLTGEKCVGIGDASGIFPVCGSGFDRDMLDKFDALVSEKGFPWRIRDILPRVELAGRQAGSLTPEGAELIDPSGSLRPGVPFCPPEGDAGTGMAATNAVLPRTGNVSAGTSIFAMVVLEKPLERVHTEIDMVATPDGRDVAMVHCNNCTSDMNAWAGVLRETAELFGAKPDMGDFFTKLYKASLEGDDDCGGVLVYNLLTGEPVAGLDKGCPAVLRTPEAGFTLKNFMRAQLYSALCALSMGMDILKEEGVAIDSLTGHGGMFKTPGVAQKYLAAAVGSTVSCMETAGEGGPYGMALLASYMLRGQGESLGGYLESRVFRDSIRTSTQPDAATAAGFKSYLARYKIALPAEKSAAELV
jgi:sugar (pentulose or hexulose) kinase